MEAQNLGNFRKTLDRNCTKVYGFYEPCAWFVEFDGTARQLTDILWPDETPEDEYDIPVGIVIRLLKNTYNGWTSPDFWEWLDPSFDEIS